MSSSRDYLTRRLRDLFKAIRYSDLTDDELADLIERMEIVEKRLREPVPPVVKLEVVRR